MEEEIIKGLELVHLDHNKSILSNKNLYKVVFLLDSMLRVHNALQGRPSKKKYIFKPYERPILR
jgi:hypothetical protein